jgi:hypothetical protein
MAAFRKQSRMIQEEFNVAMKLIALCQSNYSLQKIDGYPLNIETLEKFQSNLTLPYLEGIEFPQEPIIAPQKEEDDGFDDFIEAPSTKEVPSALEPIPTVQDRSKLIDEAFGNLMPEPTSGVDLKSQNEAASNLETNYPQVDPQLPVYHEGNVQFTTSNKDTGEVPIKVKHKFDFDFNDKQIVPVDNNSPNIESSNTQPINVSDWKSSEEAVNPPLDEQVNIQANEEFDDDFGEFQESNTTPAMKIEETPVIYQLSSEDIEAQKNTKKKEQEVEEEINIDEEENKDQEYVEVKQAYDFGATNKEILSEPVHDQVVQEGKESKLQENWANFIDIDFGDSAEAGNKEVEEKVAEEDNKEMDEDNLLENFLSAIAEKMTENSKVSPPKETPQVIPEVRHVPVPVQSRNIFYLSDKSKPVIEEDEKDLSTNTNKLKEIEEWLWFNEDTESYSKLHEHLINLQQMNEYDEMKRQVTKQEEFEKAIEYKNKVNAAKDKLLSDKVIKSFLRSLDENETMGKLIDKVISLNDIPLVHYKHNDSTNSSKANT